MQDTIPTHIHSVTLLGGKHVDTSFTIEHDNAYDMFDNLLSEIVMENFAEILKIATSGKNIKRINEILYDEVTNIIENHIDNHKFYLEIALFTMVLRRFEFFYNHVYEKQQKDLLEKQSAA